MKKLLLFALLCTLSLTGFAQFKFKGVGGGLSFGSQAAINSSGNGKLGLGIEVNALAQIAEKIDGEAALIIYFPSSTSGVDFNMTTFNLNGHYNFFEQDKLSAYGLAGLSMTFGTTTFSTPEINYGYGYVIPASETSDSFSEIGLNIGAGGAYAVSDKLDLTSQLGYTISDADQLFFNVGVMYKF